MEGSGVPLCQALCVVTWAALGMELLEFLFLVEKGGVGRFYRVKESQNGLGWKRP